MLQGPVTAGPDGLSAGTEATGEPLPVPPAIRELRARRRRRRKPSEARNGTASQAQGPTDGGEGAGSGGAGAAPRQRRRHRTAPGDAPAGDRPPREDRGPRREGHYQTDRPSERGPRGGRDGRREGGPRDRRGRPPGRGRDAAPRKIERKLYHIDSVVDRGFEDVEAEGDTRRVHWTILKRTTADQVSRKALSAVYVLQRDGADSEFPSLGAARDAVNKKIVHPEKLTRSKAEYAAEKK